MHRLVALHRSAPFQAALLAFQRENTHTHTRNILARRIEVHIFACMRVHAHVHIPGMKVSNRATFSLCPGTGTFSKNSELLLLLLVETAELLVADVAVLLVGWLFFTMLGTTRGARIPRFSKCVIATFYGWGSSLSFCHL